MCRVGILAAAVGLVLVLVLPRGASAAYPGPNGDLVYSVPPCNPGSAERPGDPGCPESTGPTLYRVRSDGTRLRRIFARNLPFGPGGCVPSPGCEADHVVPSDGSDPVWSPDGLRIAFIRDRFSREGCLNTDVLCYKTFSELVVGDVATGKVRTVISPADKRFGPGYGGYGYGYGALRGPSWSPDGRSLVFEYSTVFLTPTIQTLYSVREDGSDLLSIDNVGTPGGTPPASLDLAWSTRNSLAFVTRNNIRLRSPNQDIREEWRDATRAGGASPAWSPSGSTLAYQCGDWLCTVRPGAARRRIVRHGRLPAWSPDGRRIALVGRRGIYTVRPDGSRLHMILRKRPELCHVALATRGCLPASLDWGRRLPPGRAAGG